MRMFGKKRRGPVIKTQYLKLHWDTEDPFVFASHHADDYPKGNAQQAPPLREIGGRDLGRDYKKIFGFRMYHGKVVPGFPMHAHWGYETVTIPEIGFIDHFDSLGNQGRYGFGDVQWVSAGSMYLHDEMYPLAYDDRPNPNNITQIMLNLPLKDKGTEPAVGMMWSENIPVVNGRDENGGEYSVKIIAGSFGGKDALPPNGVSLAANENNRIRILMIRMSPGSKIVLPAVTSTINRNLYFISGGTVGIGGEAYESSQRLKLKGDEDITMTNEDAEGTYWLLEGEPIGERMSSFGPVILGSDKDVRKAMDHIRRNEFDSWPWDLVDKFHPKGTERFIRFSDDREERPPV
ncbi:MAG: pirin family protein [Candidatus Methanoplasma sp.]|jgi:redox-sensitive bicupin YhaK (pirin superfamily)|nr:pirin family protein [Candidatus Methanoplasma sp.]